jgi:aryl-alcohol dehydrogenase-like predicted oxidoreductase
MPGTTQPHRLDENLGADSVELAVDELALIDHPLSRVTVEGARYPADLAARVGK